MKEWLSNIHPNSIDTVTRVSIVAWFALYIAGIWVSKITDTYSLFVSILFFLPSFLYVSFRALKHYVLKWVYFLVWLSSPLYLCLWIIYPFLDDSYLVKVALTCAALLFCGVILFTWSIMSGFTDHAQGTELRSEVQSKSFWLLCTSLGLFLCITYLFSFAFAFHDKDMKRLGNIGLYVNPTTLDSGSIDPGTSVGHKKIEIDSESIADRINNSWKIEPSKADNVLAETARPICSFHEIEVPQCESARALFRDSLVLVLKAWSSAADYEEILKKITAFIESPDSPYNGKWAELEYDIQISLGKGGISKATQDEFIDSIKLLNKAKASSLSHVFFENSESKIKPEEINKIGTIIVNRISKNTENQRVLIVIVGHTDDIPVKDNNAQDGDKNFISNYELSEARAMMVKALLLKKILGTKTAWPNIEWEIIPAATTQFLEGNKEDIAKNSARRVDVWISVLPQHISEKQMASYDNTKTLSLLEYIYFTTTTGYGDITPASDLAKFITTLVNFVEIFFMIIFLNVLLSFSQKNTQVICRNLSKGPRANENISIVKEILHKIRSKNETLATKNSSLKRSSLTKDDVESLNQQIDEALKIIDDEIISTPFSSEV